METKRAISASLRIERREMLAAGLSGATLMVLTSATTWAADAGKPTYVYVGSYTKKPPGGGSNNPVGLSVFRFDPQSGVLTPVQQVASANPSFVALDPSKRFLYVVNEIDDYEGKKSGSIEAYAIDADTGTLKLLNRQTLNSPIPAHLAVDPMGRYVVVANYIGGDFVVLPIEPDGRVGPVSGVLKDVGAGPNKDRQQAPHPHSVVFDPDGRFIAAADLGIDKVQTFRLVNGGLERVSEASVAPGAGPRHSPSARRQDALCDRRAERNSHCACLRPRGRQDRPGLQTISTERSAIPATARLRSRCIRRAGSSRLHRGAQSIVGYRIDAATGKLSVIGFASQGVNFPRNFAIDPGGRWLFVANQKADNIVQFEINLETGELRPTGQVTPSITPVAMVFRTPG